MNGNIELSRTEYDLLRGSMESLSTKMDAILNKINNIDKKTVVLEEWRKHHESRRNDDVELWKDLHTRVAALEKYRFYLIGMSTIIAGLISVAVAIYQ